MNTGYVIPQESQSIKYTAAETRNLSQYSPELVWTFWRTNKSLSSADNPTTIPRTFTP